MPLVSRKWFDVIVGVIPATIMLCIAVMLGSGMIIGAVIALRAELASSAVGIEAMLWNFLWLIASISGAVLGTIALWSVVLQSQNLEKLSRTKRALISIGLFIGTLDSLYWLFVVTNVSRDQLTANLLFWIYILGGPPVVALLYLYRLAIQQPSNSVS